MTTKTYLARHHMARIERKPSAPDTPLWVWVVYIGLLYALVVNT